MLKMALLDCAINEKCCSVDGGRGICPIFSSPPRGIWQLKSPHRREFAIHRKKMLMPGGQPGGWGGGGRSWNWLMYNWLLEKLFVLFIQDWKLNAIVDDNPFWKVQTSEAKFNEKRQTLDLESKNGTQTYNQWKNVE